MLNPLREWTAWRREFILLPKRLNDGSWAWLQFVEVRRRAYENAFSLTGMDFHREYRRGAARLN